MVPGSKEDIAESIRLSLKTSRYALTTKEILRLVHKRKMDVLAALDDICQSGEVKKEFRGGSAKGGPPVSIFSLSDNGVTSPFQEMIESPPYFGFSGEFLRFLIRAASREKVMRKESGKKLKDLMILNAKSESKVMRTESGKKLLKGLIMRAKRNYIYSMRKVSQQFHFALCSVIVDELKFVPEEQAIRTVERLVKFEAGYLQEELANSLYAFVASNHPEWNDVHQALKSREPSYERELD